MAEHDEPNGRRAGGDTAGGDQGLPSGVLPRLSPLSSETRGTSALSSGTSVAAREEGLLLLTRFLSNVIVACGQVQQPPRRLGCDSASPKNNKY